MKYFLVAVLLPLISTCSHTHHHNKNTYNYTGEETAHHLPRDAFIFVSVKEENKICIFKRCLKVGETAKYMGSGFVIKNTKNGSLVITAAHVCTSEPTAFFTTFKLIDIDGKKYIQDRFPTNKVMVIMMINQSLEKVRTKIGKTIWKSQ